MNKRGFTLIELLVVIAIIGVLSSIVLVSVNGATNKAKDTAIKGGLDQVRIAGELSYDTDGNYSAVCTETGGASGNSTLSATGDYGRIATNVATNAGSAPACNEDTNSTAYAAWAPLVAASGSYACVDSTGASKTLTSAPAADATVCP